MAGARAVATEAKRRPAKRPASAIVRSVLLAYFSEMIVV
jgi:hypothetical protein